MDYKKNTYYDVHDNVMEVGYAINVSSDITGTYCDIYGNIYTYVDGMFHSTNDEPAITMVNGDKHWYKHGVQHRENKPAIIFVDKPCEYYYNGERIKLEDYLGQVKKGVDNT